MPNNIDRNTEHMIRTYLAYGSVDAISVDEYLKFRRQAVSEQKSGFLHMEGHHEEHRQEHGFTEDAIPMTSGTGNGSVTAGESQMESGGKPKPADVCMNNYHVAEPESTDIRPAHDTDDSGTDGFTDASFLSMMKQIED